MTQWKFDLVPAPAPGSIVRGHVDWRDALLRGWEWPYVAIHGANPGPAVLVLAGVHGSEYVSIDAAIRLGATLNPADINGQILCLPLLNPPAFWERAPYVNPIDNLNPNRVFPGKPNGTFTERLAHHVTQRAMRHADAIIDLHGGDIPEALVAFTIHEETGDSALDARSQAMAEAFGLPAMLAQPQSNSPIGGTTYATAARMGIPAIIAEDGGQGVYDPNLAERMHQGTRNVLRQLGVLPGGAPAVAKPHRYGRFVWVRTANAGFFRTAVSVGDDVTLGQSLGTIVDFFGAIIEDVKAEADGRILFLVISAAVARQGLICGIGVP